MRTSSFIFQPNDIDRERESKTEIGEKKGYLNVKNEESFSLRDLCDWERGKKKNQEVFILLILAISTFLFWM